MNAEASIQSLPRMRLSFLGRGFLCRALLVAIFVTLTHQFQWGGLRYFTSEAVLCLSRLVGLSVERVSADTIRVQGNLFQFVTSCTFVDVVMGAIPLVWAFTKSIANNLLTLVPLTAGLFTFNIVRLEIGQLLYARGAPWVLADDLLGGIAYFAVWIFIVSRFKKYWWQAPELRPIDRAINLPTSGPRRVPARGAAEGYEEEKMTRRGIQMSVTRTIAAMTVLFTVGAAHAATISELNTNPSVVMTQTNLLGRPMNVAVDQAGHLYVMTYRGWIYSLSGTLGTVGSARLPGLTTIPAVALAVTATGDVYAGRQNGTIFHYNSALTQLGTATVTGTLVGLTVDGGGNVYAANTGGTIFKMNSSLVSLGQGTVTVAAGSAVKAIHADISTGNLYVAISDGTVYRLNTSLATLATGTVSGTPVNIASDSAGDVIVATSTGLYKISPSIATLNSLSQTGLVGVDLDDAGDVVAADSGGTVYVMNTALSAPRTTPTGISPTRSIAINVTGSIYVVGGPDGASEGEPHLTTIDGVRYDFQSAGEFVLFRHTRGLEGPVCGAKIDAPESRHDDHDAVEIQVRQVPVATTANTCVSVNGAVAARVGEHKVTYEPNLNGQPDPSGLQLRVDRKLINLDPSGMKLGDDGRIIPTSTPGGLEVDFPDDTVLFVTPGWWASQSKWYLNVNVEPGRRACGLVGTVPAGSWLPALPDGTSMGPKPTSAHDQYVALNERFADAWRLTDKTSLFDYAPGTSTETFTMRGWPPENGKCDIPGAVPAEGASEEVAKEACKGVPGDPANCTFDVQVTGLTNIANTYVASRKVQPVPETTQPECHCEREAGGGTVALLTFLGLLALWILPIQARRAAQRRRPAPL